jgi:diadenosine tetraphosphate (Ap4A) HIT family hydrolase
MSRDDSSYEILGSSWAPHESGYTTISAFTDSAPTGEPCEFCDVPPDGQAPSAFDLTLPLGEGSVGLKPTLGMLVPGYLLAITRAHVTSLAQLEREQLHEIDESLQVQERGWAEGFESQYFRFEHGSDGLDSCGPGSGACVSHAHLHLVPGREAAERMQAEMKGYELDEYADLAEFRGRPYLYLGHEGRHLVEPEPNLPSQWGRRIIAATYGNAIWDWGISNGAQQLATTLLRLDGLPAGTLTVDPLRDTLTITPDHGGFEVKRSRLIVESGVIVGVAAKYLQAAFDAWRNEQ